MLLANYGQRAGEIERMRLEDVDWRGDGLHIAPFQDARAISTAAAAGVGAALIAYLRRGRPATDAREIFIRAHAPYRGFASGSSLRRSAAGSTVPACRPPASAVPTQFRHARAVSLLRSGVPPNVIGDVLGHRSATPYLKLALDELRDVALEIGELLVEDAR